MSSSQMILLENSFNTLLAKYAQALRDAIAIKDSDEIDRILSLMEAGLPKDKPAVQS